LRSAHHSLTSTTFRRLVRAFVQEHTIGESSDALDQDLLRQVAHNVIWQGYWKEVVLNAETDEIRYDRVPKGSRGSFPVTVMRLDE